MATYGFGRSVFHLIWVLTLSMLFAAILCGFPYFVTGTVQGSWLLPLVAVGCLAGVAVCVRSFEQGRLAEVGLAHRPRDLILFALGLLAAVAMTAVFVFAASAAEGRNRFPDALAALQTSGRSPLSFLWLPLIEELLHRGYFLHRVLPRLRFWQRSALSAAVFSATHWTNPDGYSAGVAALAFGLGTFLFGLLLNNLVGLTGSIWFGLGLHWLYNFAVTTLFLQTEHYGRTVVCTDVLLALGIAATAVLLYRRAAPVREGIPA